MGLTPPIVCNRDGPILMVELHRPKVLNALNAELLGELAQVIEAYEVDDKLQVAILSGAGGRAFSTGVDLAEMTRTVGSHSAFPTPEEGAIEGLLQVERCSKPLIAAIDGYCLAGGFELALCCDLRVASRASVFGLPEARRSLLGGPALQHLSRAVPIGEALFLHLTGLQIAADRAHQIGLIQGIADDRAGLDALAWSMAEAICDCAPLAVRAIKRIVTIGREMPAAQARALALPYQQQISHTEDAIEGPLAFVEKRKPHWRSR